MEPMEDDLAPEPASENHFAFAEHQAADPLPDTPSRLPLILAVAATLAWIVLVLALAGSQLTRLTAIEGVQFVAALASVPILIALVWLLTQRNSRAEAVRFGLTAHGMRQEAAALQHSVAAVTRSLDANRVELAKQVSALMEMGHAAQQRLGAVSSGFADEIAAADAHARSLSDAAAATQASLGVLLASLPRATTDIEAVATLLDRAAHSAGDHAAALDAQLVALGRRGEDADMIATGAAQRLAAHIQRMEASGDNAGARLESVAAEMSATVDLLLDRTAHAVDESRKSIAAQGEAMLAMVSTHQSALEISARDSADALADRIGSIDTVIERVTARLDAHRVAGDAMVDQLHAGIDQVETRMAALQAQGIERNQMLAASISALTGSADAMTVALEAGDAMATRTIVSAEQLLVALDAAAREIDETLPEALARLDTRLTASKQVVSAAKPELLALVTAAESTHDAIEAIAGVIAEQRRTLDTLSATLLDTLSAGRAKADALGHVVDETIERTHRFAEEAAPRLVDALLRVRETAVTAADEARDTLAGIVPQAAGLLEQASSEAMRRATADTVQRQIQAIADATDQAVAAATRATERVAAQVQSIAEQAAVVETHVEEARNEREAADRDTFARRASLLIESLNSAAIDLTKIYAPDVTDSAWGAYLKGDRGVFTRRAVRILDAVQARDIARLYDDDAKVREQINRYIHDFEAMLRGVLAQRDGSPLGVTLLSSDMGKLYVALAQAIERLR